MGVLVIHFEKFPKKGPKNRCLRRAFKSKQTSRIFFSKAHKKGFYVYEKENFHTWMDGWISNMLSVFLFLEIDANIYAHETRQIWEIFWKSRSKNEGRGLVKGGG